MLESFLITSRETLEASLVIGVTLAYLNKTHSRQYKRTVYLALLAGILVSIAGAVLFGEAQEAAAGAQEALFEGITMLVGAVLLTTMILWMLKQRAVHKKIEYDVDRQLNKTKLLSHVGLFSLVFISIVREGIETVVFLGATQYASGTSLLGGVLGVLVAIIVGYVFFMGSKRINLRVVFTVSSLLLIAFAAGLVAHGTHELIEAGVLPALSAPLYDLSAVVSATSVLGSFLRGLFGYNQTPVLLEAVLYSAYVALVGAAYVRAARTRATSSRKA